MSGKAIVLDANILVRTVLGTLVREVIAASAATGKCFAPDVAYADARKYLPSILAKRGVDGSAALAALDQLELVVQPIDHELYAGMRQPALARSALLRGQLMRGSALVCLARPQHKRCVAEVGRGAVRKFEERR